MYIDLVSSGDLPGKPADFQGQDKEDVDVRFSFRLSNAGLFSIIGLALVALICGNFSTRRVSPPAQYAPSATLERVVTKEFCLVDDSGQTRARIAMNEHGAPAIQLLDRSGQQRAQLRLNKDDMPSLRLYDANGTLRSVTGFNLMTSEPKVILFDQSGAGKSLDSVSGWTAYGETYRDEDVFSNWRSNSFLFPPTRRAQEETATLRRLEAELARARAELERVRAESRQTIRILGENEPQVSITDSITE
jgi:hypothetical protein